MTLANIIATLKHLAGDDFSFFLTVQYIMMRNKVRVQTWVKMRKRRLVRRYLFRSSASIAIAAAEKDIETLR